MKKALVAVDESPISVSLIEYAFDFAVKEGLDFLDFIHVTSPAETPMIISEPEHPADLPVPASSLARERMREMIVRHMEDPEQPAVPFNLLVLSGTPYEEIIGDLPLIWDGTNGRQERLGPGLYFIQIRATNFKKVLKVLIVR